MLDCFAAAVLSNAHPLQCYTNDKYTSRDEKVGGVSVYLVSLVPAVSMSAILICQTIPLKSAYWNLKLSVLIKSTAAVPWDSDSIRW